MRTEAQKRAEKKYRQRMRAQKKYHEVTIAICLQRKSNSDLLEILERIDSKSGAIKQALYEHWIVEGHLPKMKEEPKTEEEKEEKDA